MSSSIEELSKLKVVDLRNELAARGLDQKGVKAVLVKRLKDAMDKEAGSETSTEATTVEDPKPAEPVRKSRRLSTDEDSKPAEPVRKSRRLSTDEDSKPAEPVRKSRRLSSDEKAHEDSKNADTPRKSTRRISGDEREEGRARRSTVVSEKTKLPVIAEKAETPSKRKVAEVSKPATPSSKQLFGDKSESSVTQDTSVTSNTDLDKASAPATTQVKTPEKPGAAVKSEKSPVTTKTPEKPATAVRSEKSPDKSITVTTKTPEKPASALKSEKSPDKSTTVTTKTPVKSPEKPIAATAKTPEKSTAVKAEKSETPVKSPEKPVAKTQEKPATVITGKPTTPVKSPEKTAIPVVKTLEKTASPVAKIQEKPSAVKSPEKPSTVATKLPEKASTVPSKSTEKPVPNTSPEKSTVVKKAPEKTPAASKPLESVAAPKVLEKQEEKVKTQEKLNIVPKEIAKNKAAVKPSPVENKAKNPTTIPSKSAEEIINKTSEKSQKEVAVTQQKLDVTLKTTEKNKTSKFEELSSKKKLEEENGDQADKETHMEVEEEQPEKLEVKKSRSYENDSSVKGNKRRRSSSSPDNRRGDKRRRSSVSPSRDIKRAKSPPKEDEPAIDANKIHLSWFDSDLHLDIDKTTFLSAKPLTDGVFAYVWAGARATHGVSNGKVCYEVKITEELKCYLPDQDRFKSDNRHQHTRKPDNSDKKDEGDKTAEKKGSDKEEAMEVNESEATESKESDKPTESSSKSEEPMEQDKTDEQPKKEEETDNQSKKEEKTDEMPNEESSKNDENKDKSDEIPIPTHCFRIGWSLSSSSLQLGEDKHSYGYDSSGKFVTDKKFVDYGLTFGVDAVIGAYLDITENSVILRFSVNGVLQPPTEIAKSELPENFVLHPHILSRNYAFEINFGEKEEPWFSIPSELTNYKFISKVDDKVSGPTRPENKSECEVLLMCGLPASGKTRWINEYLAKNQEKNYTVIGNSSILERMTVFGEPLKSKYKGKWRILVDRMQKCLNRLLTTAPTRRRNYIIDQTNVFASAQSRKMRPFEGFKRKAVIVIVGEEDQAKQLALQEEAEGKEILESTLIGMKANMALPEAGDFIDEVTYVGLEEKEAREMIKKYHEEGKAALRDERRDRERSNYNKNNQGRNFQRHGSYQSYDRRNWQSSSRRDDRKYDHRSRDYRGSSYDQRSRDHYSSQSGGYDRYRSSGRSDNWGGSSSSGYSGRSHSGGWNQQNFGNRSHGQSWGNQGWEKYGSNSGGGHQRHGYGGNWNYHGQQSNWNQKK